VRAHVFLLVLLACVSAPASAQTDSHVMTDATQQLCRVSAYAHGYVHGYEDGFRIGNLDIHMGRQKREVAQVMKTAKVRPKYRRSYGEKAYFERAFKEGFREGYDDAQEGRSFRALERASTAAEGMAQHATGKPTRNYDAAFEAGFTAGRGAAGSFRKPADLSRVAEWCKQQNPKAAADSQYCEAYARGFRFGVFQDASEREAVQSARSTPGTK